MKRLPAIILAAVSNIGLLNDPASACSRILLSTPGHHVVARTMDLFMPDHARVVVYPRGIARDGGLNDGRAAHWTSKYGSVTVNSLGVTTSDGINEKGLVANLLYLHGTDYESRDDRPGVGNLMLCQYLLDVAATVPEALAELDRIQVVSAAALGREWPLHISISDATGDSAVIEFVNKARVVHRGKDSAVMTNEPPLDWQLNNLRRFKYFGGNEPLPGDIDPPSRFVRASAFLNTAPSPKDSAEALEEAFSIAKTVSVPRGARNTSGGVDSEDTWPTLWTSLADAPNKLYFFQASGSPNMIWIDLGKRDFSRGAPIRYVSGEDISLTGEVTKKLAVMKSGVRPPKPRHEGKPKAR